MTTQGYSLQPVTRPSKLRFRKWGETLATRHKDWGRGRSNWERKWCPLPHCIFNLFSKVTGFLLEPAIFSGDNHLHLFYWGILTRGSHVQNIL